MSVKENIIKEIDELPEELSDEVIDFIHFIKMKKTRKIPETLLLSESSLKKEWLLPEEDEAWQDL